MKNLTLLLIILLCGCAKAQIPNPLSCKNTRDINESLDISKVAENRGIEQNSLSYGLQLDTNISQITWLTIDTLYDTPITIGMLFEYETKCLSDTLIAKICECGYIRYCYIFDEFEVMLTLEQLEKFGYKYKFRWVVSTDPIEFEYYFVKEPTFKGFIKWLKNK